MITNALYVLGSPEQGHTAHSSRFQVRVGALVTEKKVLIVLCIMRWHLLKDYIGCLTILNIYSTPFLAILGRKRA